MKKLFAVMFFMQLISVHILAQDPAQDQRDQISRDKMRAADKNAKKTQDLIRSKTVSPGNKPSVEPIDISSEVSNAKMKNGSQMVGSTGGIKLYADVTNGVVKKYTAVNSSGQQAGVATSTTVAKGKTRCRACVSDDSGTVCWWINCKDLPRPPDTR